MPQIAPDARLIGHSEPLTAESIEGCPWSERRRSSERLPRYAADCRFSSRSSSLDLRSPSSSRASVSGARAETLALDESSGDAGLPVAAAACSPTAQAGAAAACSGSSASSRSRTALSASAGRNVSIARFAAVTSSGAPRARLGVVSARPSPSDSPFYAIDALRRDSRPGPTPLTLSLSLRMKVKCCPSAAPSVRQLRVRARVTDELKRSRLGL